MQKAKMQTEYGTQENIARIKRLFPHCVTEALGADGRLAHKVDFDLLKQELSGELIEEGEERYCLNWPGKKESLLTANKAIDKTLRPIDAFSSPVQSSPVQSSPVQSSPVQSSPQTSSDAFGRKSEEAEWASADLFGEQQESEEQRSFEQASGGINFATTENIFIEGDNLDALKLLQETYLNKIKLIYIDPPYNTGRDFIYKDKRIADADEYLEDSWQIDEDGNYLVANPISNGRFHSDWLSFIYPRLKLARNLLRDDGVIFISIDDNEQANLKKICDEIFGAENFINNIIWEKKYAPANDAKWLSDNHDFIICYAKDKTVWKPNLLPRTAEQNERYSNPDNDPRGVWKSSDLLVKTYSAAYAYPITTPAGRVVNPPQGRSWRIGPEGFARLIADNRVWFGSEGNNVPSIKRFLTEVKDGITPLTIWNYKEVGHNQTAAREIRDLFQDSEAIFDTPKPTMLIDRIIRVGGDKDGLILDFFAGSGTTAQAVMQLNAEDGGRRRFILVQLPEEVDKKSEKVKAGFTNIAEICKERIRRAGQMIKTGKYPDGRPVKDWQPPKNPDLDIGFRVFKIASSNMREDYYRLPQETAQNELESKADNIKPGRSAEDLLFQLFLEWGVPLSSRIEKEEIDGKEILFVNKSEFEGIQTDMIACFDKGLTESLLIKLAQLKPMRAVFRDHGFATDSVRENLEGIFKQIAPDTDLRVI